MSEFEFSLFKGRTVTTDRHFLLKCIHTNKFILYSGPQSYMAARFSTKESPQADPVEEWSEAHLMGGHFRNSLFSDLVFQADASTAVV